MAGQQGITWNAAEGRYDTGWGWVKLDLVTGALNVAGPAVEEWLDIPGVMRTAALFVAYSPVAMAVVLAVHQQYAAWQGLRSLPLGR